MDTPAAPAVHGRGLDEARTPEILQAASPYWPRSATTG